MLKGPPIPPFPKPFEEVSILAPPMQPTAVISYYLLGCSSQLEVRGAMPNTHIGIWLLLECNPVSDHHGFFSTGPLALSASLSLHVLRRWGRIPPIAASDGIGDACVIVSIRIFLFIWRGKTYSRDTTTLPTLPPSYK